MVCKQKTLSYKEENRNYSPKHVDSAFKMQTRSLNKGDAPVHCQWWKTETKWGVDEPLLDKVERAVMNKCISGYFFQNKGRIAEIPAINNKIFHPKKFDCFSAHHDLYCNYYFISNRLNL